DSSPLKTSVFPSTEGFARPSCEAVGWDAGPGGGGNGRRSAAWGGRSPGLGLIEDISLTPWRHLAGAAAFATGWAVSCGRLSADLLATSITTLPLNCAPSTMLTLGA